MMTDNILIVEDDAHLREWLAYELETEGYHVTVAADGLTGLKAAQDQPNLILLDVQLPRMDGFEICQTLQYNLNTVSIPVIFLTARTTLDAEKIVRDPIMLGDDGTMVCVGEVPEESYVDILSGSVPSLVNAAANALALGRAAFKGQSTSQTTLFIDCISRVLFLEEEFSRELKAVFDENIPLIGALTLGEIANSGQDYLEFYNKTAVVGILEA